jgi:hypothetical protein
MQHPAFKPTALDRFSSLPLQAKVRIIEQRLKDIEARVVAIEHGAVEGGPSDIQAELDQIEQLGNSIGWQHAIFKTPPKAFYHSGDLGDVIYALPSIHLSGGGKLYLGPSVRFSPRPRKGITRENFALISPLLEEQSYVHGIEYVDRQPSDDKAFDLNAFRRYWVVSRNHPQNTIKTLAAMQCWTAGVLGTFREDEPWLTVTEMQDVPYFVIHRSPRYRNPEFPWQMIVRKLGKQLMFVGLENEHADFQNTFNCKVEYHGVQNFLELANFIAGSLGFIGNQSFPCAIALGCGQRVAQESWKESPDCVFRRSNFLTQPFNEKQLDDWTTVPLL